ncbi:MAG: hypothetical protein HZB46_08325 [Solirubrobacterales bacterium]|nr:hypothetical protein [Solirubrobacterales bacterium]
MGRTHLRHRAWTALLDRLVGPSAAPRVIHERPDELGYELRADPLLDLLPEEEWRAMERRATRPR